MTVLTPFRHPLFLGFDRLEELFERLSAGAKENYPPFDIKTKGEAALRITIAVAGFAAPELDVSVEDNQLVVRGRRREETEGTVYLHQGIAARQFQRSFILADGLEVEGAELANGLLHIDLTRRAPKPEIKRVPIRAREAAPQAAKPNAQAPQT
jgi:HSP20 family molecular chaperone IbpA